MDVAIREATSSLREIAERHGVSPKELSERFSESKSSAKPKPPVDEQRTPAEGDDSVPNESQSAIEKELQERKDGPELPELPSIEEEDDLF